MHKYFKKILYLLLFLFDTFRIYGLPVVAALGIILCTRVIQAGSQPKSPYQPISSPPTSPFQTAVSGAGIIESQSENISVASPVSGVVSEVFATVGSDVQKESPLFKLDDSVQRANVEQRTGALSVSKAQYQDALSQYEITQKLADKSAMSIDDLTKKKNALLIAEAKVNEAQGSLNVATSELSQRVVKAPITGTVLKVNVRVGELVPLATTSTPLLVIGDIKKLRVRVDINEDDAWRVKAGANASKKARATLRGNSNIGFDLNFVKFEPYVIPKRSLTGDAQERVDTRVLQVLYEFEPKELPVFVGQLVDVFIESDDKI